MARYLRDVYDKKALAGDKYLKMEHFRDVALPASAPPDEISKLVIDVLENVIIYGGTAVAHVGLPLYLWDLVTHRYGLKTVDWLEWSLENIGDRESVVPRDYRMYGHALRRYIQRWNGLPESK